MVRVLSARFSLELTTQFPFRQSFSLLLQGASFESRPKRIVLHEKCTFILFSGAQCHGAFEVRSKQEERVGPYFYAFVRY